MATLSQLLATAHLGLRLVQAAPEDPELTWVSTTELLQLADYLEGGELVLTTGISLSAEDPRWRDFVAGLSRARIAAIGFGVGVAHERIPAPLVAAASDYRVALVEVPPPTPFIAVSKATSNLLRADELRAARQALQAHERLLEGARGSADSASVLASIAQATGRQLALQVGGSTATGGRITASTAGFVAAAQTAPERVETVPLDQEDLARMLVASGPPLGPEAQAVIAAGALVLGMNFRDSLAEHEHERERWSRLTLALLRDAVADTTLRVFDPELPGGTSYRALAVQGASERVAQWRRAPRQGVDRLVSAGTPRADGVSLAWQLCPADHPTVTAALQLAAAHDLDVVVGRSALPGQLLLSHNSASALVGSLSRLAALYASPRTPQVLWAEQATPLLEALLAAAGNTAAPAHTPGAPGQPAHTSGSGIRSLVAAVLGPLADPPARTLGQSGTLDGPPTPSHTPGHTPGQLGLAEQRTLRTTLHTLLEHHGQRTPAATGLGIHRNTLRDRVTRIEQLIGRSLDDPDARAEIWLALRLAEQYPSS